MIEPKPIELLKVGYRMNSAGDLITFRLQLDDGDSDVARARLNTRFGAVLVKLGNDEMPE